MLLCVFVCTYVCFWERRVVANCPINKLAAHFSTGMHVCASLIASQPVHQSPFFACERVCGTREQIWIVVYYFFFCVLTGLFALCFVCGGTQCVAYMILKIQNMSVCVYNVSSGWMTLRLTLFKSQTVLFSFLFSSCISFFGDQIVMIFFWLIWGAITGHTNTITLDGERLCLHVL